MTSRKDLNLKELKIIFLFDDNREQNSDAGETDIDHEQT